MVERPVAVAGSSAATPASPSTTHNPACLTRPARSLPRRRIYVAALDLIARGERSSVGRAPGCGPGGRRFESGRSPLRAREERYPTFAWRLGHTGRALIYASDVARLTPELERFSRGAAVLVIDGAMWQRRLFSHLTIDAALPELCGWKVERVLLTQIGRTCPSHERFESEVAARCPRARPAHDGLTVRL